MSYSFRCFIEENYFDVLKNAVDRFIQEDDTDDCTVRVKSVIIDDIDYSALKNAQDHVKFKIIPQSVKLTTKKHQRNQKCNHEAEAS